MIASLPMYDWPEVQSHQDSYWQAIRQFLGFGPANLTRGFVDYTAHWLDPDLLLSQTCGLPYRAYLHDKVTLIGTPDFGLPDNQPAHYHSVLVVNAQAGGTQLSDFMDGVFAYNEKGSQSGWAAAQMHLSQQGLRPTRFLETGGHRASIKAVAEGHADLAAIDAVTWELALRHEPATKSLRVIDTTKPTPGLPYICALVRDPEPLRAAISAAIDSLDASVRAALLLHGLQMIPASDYLALPVPQAPAG
jgi:ABC-type phosphate/phosphonate transport system substrate-binding protein